MSATKKRLDLTTQVCCYLISEMFLNVILELGLRDLQVELHVTDRTLVVTLVNVPVDVLLDLEETLRGELHLTEGTVGHEAGLGEAVRGRGSRGQLRHGGDGGEGGGTDILRLERAGQDS